MKRLALLSMLFIGPLAAMPVKSQVNVHVNIGSQPNWGPSGYRHADYYYLPEVQSYYHVPTRRFISYSGNHWVYSRYLPGRYRNYNLYKARKVVINSPRPYLRHHTYSSRYASVHSRPLVFRNNSKTKFVKHTSKNKVVRYNSRPGFVKHHSRSRVNKYSQNYNRGRGHSNGHRSGRH